MEKSFLGKIRLVNPNRGTVRAAIYNGLVLSEKNDRYEFHYNLGGYEFRPGRAFSRIEIIELANFTFSTTSNVDDLGVIPATGQDPRSWKWVSFAGGQRNLNTPHKPNVNEIAIVCGEILSPKESEIFLDRYEIWLTDWKTNEPIALAVTAETLEAADWQTFSPIWRFCIASNHSNETREFEDQVNCLINPSGNKSKVNYSVRLFERTLDGGSIEWMREGKGENLKPRTYSNALPSGLLAEPWETIRIELESTLEKELN
ncbi:hypothetical protein [Leptospira santarosai]|uniref:hypothetical protein n=1 Tax=Leptospira santarosai TaxID=28183 RepID=UPI0002BAD427|nr:hypothetical protein [Leptospira santarosai]EMF89795.1 hypothetical protein LEP1GSC005_1304 [Leptospira santarosai str. ST188]MDI7218839.1 hypothetical protein [Leptospira santarosai]MDO6384461.1 hypothetical protein [Leptospira santarosai]